MTKILGKISSEESMGLVDGPGIRYVVFLQGCMLRCKYCHNPETWDINGNCQLVEPKDLIDKISRYKAYFGKEGGVTFSGGEPLLQPDFLIKCLTLAKEKGIHTAIDTAGKTWASDEQLEKILSLSDLVILDIKAVKEEDYKELTGQNMSSFKKFISLLNKHNKKLWLRQVIVPNLNDTQENIKNLSDFIEKNFKKDNILKIELLPYKSIGVHKYRTLGLKYRLEGVEDMNEDKCKNLEKQLIFMLNL